MLIDEKKKRIMNIVLCAAAIGIMASYSLCTSSCRYLRGSVFGLDLKYIGMVYMTVLIGFNIAKKDFLNTLSLAVGVGGEIFLVALQIKEWKFCPFCLIFGAIVVFLFFFNLRAKWIPILAVAMISGFFLFFFFFHGSLAPAYDYGLAVKDIYSC